MYKADGSQRREFFIKYTRYVGSRMDTQDLICASYAQTFYVHRISPLKNALITRDESTRCLIPDKVHGVVGEGQKGENIPTVPSPTTGSARVDLLNLLGL
jgi:hypothetical protein